MFRGDEVSTLIKEKRMERLVDSSLVAVIRRQEVNKVLPIAEALVEGGVGALEITVDSIDAYSMIKNVKAAVGNRALVGAGTVLDTNSARLAIEAGADFLFSPSFNPEVVAIANEHQLISIPGVMTPTEIVNAYESGADILKVFPAGALGVAYIKDLQGPLGHIPMMPTGGVDVSNVQAYIENGAVAVGVGGLLVDSKAIAEEQYEVLTKKAKEFKRLIQEAKMRKKTK